MLDLGGKGGGAPEPDADQAGGVSDGDADNYTPKDDFEREGMDFLDDTKPMGERLMALKEAIHLCTNDDYGSSGEGGGKRPAGGLALIFGKDKKG